MIDTTAVLQQKNYSSRFVNSGLLLDLIEPGANADKQT